MTLRDIGEKPIVVGSLAIHVDPVDVDGPGAAHRHSADVIVHVPERITAQVENRDLDIRVDVEVGLDDDGNPRFRRLTVEGGDLPNDILRTVGLGALMDLVVQYGASKYRRTKGEDGQAQWTLDLLGGDAWMASPDEVRAILRRRRRATPTAEIEEAVAAYDAAKAAGVPDPTLATAKAINRSRATAHRRVQAGRRRIIGGEG